MAGSPRACTSSTNPSTAQTYHAGLGAKWEVTGKSVGEVSVGWVAKTFKQASTRGSGSFSGLGFRLNTYWMPQEQTRLTLSLYRQPQETTQRDTRFFVRTGTYVQLHHGLTYKRQAAAAFLYNHDSYSDPVLLDNKRAKRDDDYTTLGAGESYQIQPWLGARTTYTYTQRLSNFMSLPYVANLWMISLQAQF